jgi:DNA uptake protein ComE-like DNA-binding protein
MRTRASILVGVLWCLALLSIVVIGFLHTTRLDLHVTKLYGDRVQAHYLALAGVEKAKALLYRNARDRSRNGKSHDGELYNAPSDFRDVSLGNGKFNVFRRGREDEGGVVIYGVSDEESRVNLNSASTDALSKLKGMTPDVLAAISDWRDGDNQISPDGAEGEYYGSLQPPYQPRNGPFQTIRELLMVRGISRDLLFGNDPHHNGLLDADDDKGQSHFVTETTLDSDLGWAGLLSVNSSVANVNVGGDSRVNVQSADETALTGVKGITADIARAIVSYRGQNRLQSIADLLDVTAAQNQNQTSFARSTSATRSGQNSTNRTSNTSSSSNSSSSGRRVVSEDLLTDIGDDVTTDNGSELAGVININTAPLDVLACLPGVDRQMAQSIISYRQSSGFFANTAGHVQADRAHGDRAFGDVPHFE